MNRIRLVHMVEDLKIGGLERVIASIVLGLNKKRYEIEVWCLSAGGDIAEELLGKGVRIKIVGLNSYHNPAKIIKLAQLIKSSKIDILHTHGYFASTMGRISALLAFTPVVITHVHSTYYNYTRRNLLIEWILSFFTAKVICVSQAAKNFVENYERISPKKTVLIYNGAVDPLAKTEERAFAGKLEESGFNENDIIIVTVASLTANKGHRYLIEAFDKVSTSNSHLRLMVVGDGPLRSELEDYVRQMGLCPKVIFSGQRSDVFNLLMKADLFVLPSIEREGLTVAIIEAMAAGLPVIGTQIGGIPEVIVNDVNGLLVPPKDVVALTNAIERMISDKSMMRKMGEKGREIFEQQFSISKMLENIESLYNQLSIRLNK